MKKLSKILVCSLVAAATICTAGLAACNNSESITIAVARGASSGTREVFEEKVVNTDGTALGSLTSLASCVVECESTGSAITTVANSKNAIAYVSYGSVASSSSIKAVSLDGVECNATTIKDGSYEISRPFNLIYQSYDNLTDAAKDFISYIESSEGQAIISEEYVTIDSVANSATSYTATSATGSVSLVGSTSVQPLMESLAAAYMKVNSNITVTVAGGGSGTGVSSAQSDTTGAVIGMASRGLKSSETGVVSREIAYDGVAIIVNSECSLTNVTIQQLYDLYANGTAIEV
ncbi:MAG: substrate-binding domain-containing protein [Clostridia bacterium]|nr:substrate-binding domain-containing protein [Clostridia bacterium]